MFYRKKIKELERKIEKLEIKEKERKNSKIVKKLNKKYAGKVLHMRTDWLNSEKGLVHKFHLDENKDVYAIVGDGYRRVNIKLFFFEVFK